MPIFKTNAGELKKLNTLTLDKKNLQQLVKDNLMEVLELRFRQHSNLAWN